MILRYLTSIRNLYNKRIRAKREEPRFLIMVFFTLTFVVARLIVYGIENKFLPSTYFNYIYYREVHIHHLVFGIIFLLIAGFIRIPQFGSTFVRFSSILYGIGAALTLDEFALWLHLDADAYYGPKGRISIDAIFIFGLLLLSSIWYGVFWKKFFEQTIIYFFFNNHKHTLSRILNGGYKFFKKHSIFFFLFFFIIIFSVNARNQQHKIFAKQNELSHLPFVVSPIISLSPSPTFSLSVLHEWIDTSTSSSIASSSSIITPSPTPLPDFCLYVPVFLYHHVQPVIDAQQKGQTSLSVDNVIFETQMAYLASHQYTTITAEQLVDALRFHTSLPPHAIVLTFDDGYEDFYTYAYPVLQKYHLIGNLFIPTGLLENIIGTNTYLHWSMLKEMQQSGLIFSYNHTWSHYALGSGNVEKNTFEIVTGKNQLEQNLGKPNTIFAYPYGSGQSLSGVHDILAQNGIVGAYSTLPGRYQCESFLFSLHRDHIGNVSLEAYGY